MFGKDNWEQTNCFLKSTDAEYKQIVRELPLLFCRVLCQKGEEMVQYRDYNFKNS